MPMLKYSLQLMVKLVKTIAVICINIIPSCIFCSKCYYIHWGSNDIPLLLKSVKWSCRSYLTSGNGVSTTAFLPTLGVGDKD